MADIIVIAVIVLVAAWAIFTIVKAKRKHGGCAFCPSAGSGDCDCGSSKVGISEAKLKEAKKKLEKIEENIEKKKGTL